VHDESRRRRPVEQGQVGLPERRRRLERSVRLEIVGERQVHGSRNPAGDRIERLHLSAPALAGSNVEHLPARIPKDAIDICDPDRRQMPAPARIGIARWRGRRISGDELEACTQRRLEATVQDPDAFMA
jgi:hypothetical protein